MAEGKNIQSYLEHHKINQLFEGMMGDLVSSQPSDPILFLITALRNKRAAKKAPGKVPQSPPSPAHSRASAGALRVKGTTVDAKPSALVARLAKTADNVRPSTSIGTMPSKSKAPTSTATARPSSQGAGLRSTSASRISSRPLSGQKAAPAKSGLPSSKTAAKPLPSSKSQPSGVRSIATPKKTPAPGKEGQLGKKGKDGGLLGKKGKRDSVTRHLSVCLDQNKDTVTPATSASDLDELFDQGLRPQGGVSESDDSEGELGHHGDELSSRTEGEEEEEVMEAWKRFRASKESPCRRPQLVVQCEVGSSGYGSPEDDSSDGDQGAGFYESPDLLREEGVAVATGGRGLRTGAGPAAVRGSERDPLITFTICTQCSRITHPPTGEEGGSVVTATTAVSAPTRTSAEEDIESVSQVGSQVSFPQWDPSSSSGKVNKESLLQMWTRPPPVTEETNSVFTSASVDTWAGLSAPKKSNRLSNTFSSDGEAESTVVGGGPWRSDSRENALAKRWADQS